ncbi:hypothetical protein ACLIA0_14230 [Bacillaceae bacterium W0354]
MEQPFAHGIHSDDHTTVHINLLRESIRYIQIYKGHHLIGTYQPNSDFHIKNDERAPITVMAVLTNGIRIEADIPVSSINEQKRQFEAGDILVACDNVGDLPPGYMGHSAMVIDEEHIIEAVTSKPQVRKSPIEEFLTFHPNHVHFRCKDEKAAKQATKYALGYLKIYNDSLNQDKGVPPFTFSPFIALDNAWDGIYCSKLVWLCYYFGANIKFENDYFLFTPEDLATTLEQDDRFKLIYKHPQFEFKIDL